MAAFAGSHFNATATRFCKETVARRARGRAVGNEMLCVRRRVTSFSFAKRFKRTAAQPLRVPGRSPAAFGDFSPVKSHPPPEGMALQYKIAARIKEKGRVLLSSLHLFHAYLVF